MVPKGTGRGEEGRGVIHCKGRRRARLSPIGLDGRQRRTSSIRTRLPAKVVGKWRQAQMHTAGAHPQSTDANTIIDRRGDSSATNPMDPANVQTPCPYPASKGTASNTCDEKKCKC